MYDVFNITDNSFFFRCAFISIFVDHFIYLGQ